MGLFPKKKKKSSRIHPIIVQPTRLDVSTDLQCTSESWRWRLKGCLSSTLCDLVSEIEGKQTKRFFLPHPLYRFRVGCSYFKWSNQVQLLGFLVNSRCGQFDPQEQPSQCHTSFITFFIEKAANYRRSSGTPHISLWPLHACMHAHAYTHAT